METIDVIYHREPDAWWADAEQVPGWTATAGTLDELRGLVEDGVRFALGREDVLIEHVLEYGTERVAVVFDFAAGRTVVTPRAAAVGMPLDARSPAHLA